ncbi:MAG: hypothetical protein AAGH92_11225, partial [Planctomycetota bacterium]
MLEPGRVVSDLLQAADGVGFSAARFEQAAGFIERLVSTPSPTLSELADSEIGEFFFPERRDGEPLSTVAVMRPQRPWNQTDVRHADLAVLHDALATVPGTHATGLDLISDQMRRQLTRDLLSSFAWSAIPITLVLAIGLRRARRVVVTLVTPAA